MYMILKPYLFHVPAAIFVYRNVPDTLSESRLYYGQNHRLLTRATIRIEWR